MEVYGAMMAFIMAHHCYCTVRVRFKAYNRIMLANKRSLCKRNILHEVFQDGSVLGIYPEMKGKFTSYHSISIVTAKSP